MLQKGDSIKIFNMHFSGKLVHLPHKMDKNGSFFWKAFVEAFLLINT